MKIEKANSKDYYISIYSSSIKEDTIDRDIKELFQKLQKRISLKGFYKINVIPKEFGLFLEVIKIEDAFYSSTLDLKIEIQKEKEVYFQTEDYFLLNPSFPIFYYENNYYGIIDTSSKEIIKMIEYGEFIFGEKLKNRIQKGQLVQ